MSMNKIFIEEIVSLLKKKERTLESLIKEIKDIFYELDTTSKFLEDFSFSFESKYTDNDNVTPEIFSDLHELSLSIADGQYETGSYYTNKTLVNKIIDEVDLYEKTILDPAGGAGNFPVNIILSLIDNFDTKEDFVEYISTYIHMNELLLSSIKIYLLRLDFICFSKFKSNLSEFDLLKICNGVFNKDFLLDFKSSSYDIIIGNPPYLGTKSLGENYLGLLKKKFGFADDLYALFIFEASKHLSNSGYFSFVTSSTYFTIKTKTYIRELLINLGLYKIILNNKENFKIKTKTSIFMCKRNTSKDIVIFNETDFSIYKKVNTLDVSKLHLNNYKFNLDSDIDLQLKKEFDISIEIFNRFPKELSTTRSLSHFKLTQEYKDIISESDILPLGLIAYIATGVDFKGNNDKVLHSLTNKKFLSISDHSLIRKDASPREIQQGLKKGKFIPAIKGTERLFVKWDNNMVSYLNSIKAPLRNLHLYGKPSIYCKTSTYELTKIDPHTLCINTAGACFIQPIIDIDLNYLLSILDNQEIKTYIQDNINNSLSFTPNDLKLIPIRIR